MRGKEGGGNIVAEGGGGRREERDRSRGRGERLIGWVEGGGRKEGGDGRGEKLRERGEEGEKEIKRWG